MDRIKDVKKVRLQDDEVLLQVFIKKTSIITLENDKGTEFNYCKVLAKGSKVEHIDVGDIVLDVVNGTYKDLKVKETVYLIIRAVGIKVAVPKDNFVIMNETKILS
jgi:hypothetical protein